jgi:hypothetical protein
VVICLVVAVGVAALLFINAKNAAAAAKEAKAAAAAQMGTYTDYDTGVAFQVPIAWEQIPLEEALEQASGFGGMPSAIVAFGDANALDPASTTGSLLMFAATDYPSGVSSMSVKEALEEATSYIDDYAPEGLSISEGVSEIHTSAMQGAQMTMEVSAMGQKAYARLCMLDAGTCIYMFMFAAGEDDWDQDKYFFENTVDSFSIVGAR